MGPGGSYFIVTSFVLRISKAVLRWCRQIKFPSGSRISSIQHGGRPPDPTAGLIFFFFKWATVAETSFTSSAALVPLGEGFHCWGAGHDERARANVVLDKVFRNFCAGFRPNTPSWIFFARAMLVTA